MQEKVRHVGKPAEPYAPVGAHGMITRTVPDGPLRITPAFRGIPAMAHVQWSDSGVGEYSTWERLSDLIQVGKRS